MSLGDGVREREREREREPSGGGGSKLVEVWVEEKRRSKVSGRGDLVRKAGSRQGRARQEGEGGVEGKGKGEVGSY
jgi:hypothetical protein